MSSKKIKCTYARAPYPYPLRPILNGHGNNHLTSFATIWLCFCVWFVVAVNGRTRSRKNSVDESHEWFRGYLSHRHVASSGTLLSLSISLFLSFRSRSLHIIHISWPCQQLSVLCLPPKKAQVECCAFPLFLFTFNLKRKHKT